MRNITVVIICFTVVFFSNSHFKKVKADSIRNDSSVTGKPVRVVSLCFKDKSLEEVVTAIDTEGEKGTDLICLPETWRGQVNPESLDGESITVISKLALRHNSYIVCPIDRQDGQRRVNSAVLIDRSGKVVCVYDKIFPYWSEFDINPSVNPGLDDVKVYEADFGKIGFAICYDAKFPEVWQRLSDKGAELVVWPSAYSGGTELQAFALMHHYYIVTSTWTGNSIVYDINGGCLLDVQPGEGITIARITLDMDRRIYHHNFNLEKRDRLLRDHGDKIILEWDMPREEWFILKAVKTGVSVSEIAHEYGLEELRDYKNRSRRQIDRLRGFEFSKKYGGYPGKRK